jgi:two-component system, response regulator
MTRDRYFLVVEDSDEDFETVMDVVKRLQLPHDVRRATSGDDALAQLQAAATGHRALPAFMLLDLNTPQGDGRDALKMMRSSESLRGVPVVVLSTSNNPRDVGFCYAHGANAFHVKPVQHDAHQRVLEAIFDYWLTKAQLPE